MAEPLVALDTTEPLTQADDRGRLRIMTIYLATDMYLAARQRDGCSPKTIDRYRRLLHKLGDMYPHIDVDELTYVMVCRCVDRWANSAPATSAQIISILSSFFDWCLDEGLIPADPSSRIKRPKLARYDERDDIKSISNAEAQKIIAAASGWREELALHLLAYTGSRRHAIAQLRRRDYDQDAGTLVFQEKGSKIIRKPVPEKLRDLLDAAVASGLYEAPADYLIPSAAKQRREGERDDRFLLKLVKDVGGRVGIDAHCHAFRAAFAVHFLETHPGKDKTLQFLLGHASGETTKHYTRRLDRMKMMEDVRDLDWSPDAERTGRDSNSRDAFTPDGLASRSLRPLGHLSTFEASPDPMPQGREPSFDALADEQTVDTPRDPYDWRNDDSTRLADNRGTGSGQRAASGDADIESVGQFVRGVAGRSGSQVGSLDPLGADAWADADLSSLRRDPDVTPRDLLGDLLKGVRHERPDVLHALLQTGDPGAVS